MKAVVFNKYGDSSQLKLVDLDLPQLAKDEVLVKVVAASVNPKDILIRKGKFKILTGKKFPQGVGFDFAGFVEDSNNSEYQKGERVYGMLNGWAGRSCAEYVNIKISELCTINDKITLESAAGVPLVCQTALQALRDKAGLKMGQSVCINGASGGVGTVAIQIAKILGAEVISISSQSNMDYCKSFGADIMIDYKDTDILKQSEKYDVFFDVFGNYSFKKCKAILKKNGVYVTTVPGPEIFKEQVKNIFRKQKAKMIVVKSKSKDLEWLFDKIKQDKLKPVVDKVFDIKDIGKAHDYIETKRAKGKVILNF